MTDREAEPSLQGSFTKEWARLGAKFAGRCVIVGPFGREEQFADSLAEIILGEAVLDKEKPIHVSPLVNRLDRPEVNRQAMAEADLVVNSLRRLGTSNSDIFLTGPLTHWADIPFNPLAMLEEYRDDSYVSATEAFELGHVAVVSLRSITGITGKFDKFQARALVGRPTGGYEWRFLF